MVGYVEVFQNLDYFVDSEIRSAQFVRSEEGMMKGQGDLICSTQG